MSSNFGAITTQRFVKVETGQPYHSRRGGASALTPVSFCDPYVLQAQFIEGQADRADGSAGLGDGGPEGPQAAELAPESEADPLPDDAGADIPNDDQEAYQEYGGDEVEVYDKDPKVNAEGGLLRTYSQLGRDFGGPLTEVPASLATCVRKLWGDHCFGVGIAP